MSKTLSTILDYLLDKVLPVFIVALRAPLQKLLFEVLDVAEARVRGEQIDPEEIEDVREAKDKAVTATFEALRDVIDNEIGKKK